MLMGEMAKLFWRVSLARAGVEELLARPEETYQRAIDYVLKKNAELYRRLA
jgi:antitoxin FitA